MSDRDRHRAKILVRQIADAETQAASDHFMNLYVRHAMRTLPVFARMWHRTHTYRPA